MGLSIAVLTGGTGGTPSASLAGTNKVTHQFSSITSCFPKCSTYPTWCCWSLGDPCLTRPPYLDCSCREGNALLRHLLWPRAPAFPAFPASLTCDQAVLASCPGTWRAHCLRPGSPGGSGSGRLSRMPSLPHHHRLISAQLHTGSGPPGCDRHTNTPMQPGLLHSVQ